MKRKGLAVFILGVLLFSCFWINKCFFQKKSSEKIKNPTFFVSVPIAKFTAFDIPCLNIEIESKQFIAIIDLGFSGYINLKSEYLKDIDNKRFISAASMWGWKGKNYIENVYEIPKIEIGDLTLSPLLLNEEHPDFDADSTILAEGAQAPFDCAQGRLGWKLFEKSNLFLDLRNSIVIFCDSLATLKNHGYLLDRFIKVPFLTDHNLVEIEALTTEGPLRCILDTGFTDNMLLKEEDREIINIKTVSKIESFQIGGTEVGTIDFHSLPFNLPFKMDAILGVDFFRDHQVFIDFGNRQIYFAPSVKEE